MKKILLASAALALTGGMASAQGLTISGDARMGVQNNGGGYGAFGNSNWRMEGRTNLNFSASAQGDHGLSFGAFWRVRQNINQNMTEPGAFNGARIWAEAAGFRLTYGNQPGAIEDMGVTTAVGAFGYTGGTFQTYGGVYAGDGLTGLRTYQSQLDGYPQMVGASYRMGDVRVGVTHVRDDNTEVAAQGTFDAFTVAAGFSDGAARYRTISATYNGGSWAASAIWSQYWSENNFTVGARADLGGGTLGGYVGRHAHFVGGVFQDNETVGGVSYRYGLGGGATIGAAVERNTARNTVAELGVIFSF